ncbi:hypothetical protein HYC85_008862 [Camellia sinensis]|uniref:HVA22-like protein n=1 Tax=Camellia sinensis TaxID=4442 RepID=A0A7J7HVB4_CAMSI|nr:hypothetical protein HYC85_008862 [Camellia sinensis]
MIGSFLTRGLAMVFGYAYPAYECFKTVEKNKPDIEQLRFWCQYWILVAVLTVGERICDTFISWVPMYSEAKLAFFIYLWYPKTKGTTYVYDSFFRPYIAKHEPEIDRNLLELRTRAGDIAVSYWQRAASYVYRPLYTCISQLPFQWISTLIYNSLNRFMLSIIDRNVSVAKVVVLRVKKAYTKKRLPQQQGPRARQPKRKPAAKKTPPPNEEPSSPASSASSSQDELEEAQELDNSQVATATPPSTALNAQQSTTVTPPLVALNAQKANTVVEPPAETSNHSNSKETETMQIESSSNKNGNPPMQETVMEEAIRVTRGRLRKSRSTANR